MSKPTAIAMTPIGVINTHVIDEEVASKRRKIVSTIRVFDEFADGLLGVEAYSHLFVLFCMDRARPADTLLSHPRGDETLPVTGVFAARGRNHPNAIGLTVVKLLNRHGPNLEVRRLDAYDGTPLLDLKPYDTYDAFTDIEVPAWFRERAMVGKDDLE